VPEDWSGMPKLQDLNLAFNLMVGNVSRVRLCPTLPRGTAGLRQLNLRANSLTGSLELRNCSQLMFLDVQVRGRGQGRAGRAEALWLC
jgi:hypothetical protein